VLPPENLRAGDVLAAAEPPGDDWIRLVEDAWDRGAAVLPLDPRLAEDERRALVRRARPTVILDGGVWTRLTDGAPAGRAALVVHTSGTAGAPKLVELERAAVDAALAGSSLALGASAGDRWLCCLPVAHVGGLLVVLRAVVRSTTVVVHPGFEPRAVAGAGADFVSVVPTMLGRLLEAGVDVSGFRAMLVGGAGLSSALRARALDAGANAVETYGLTETCGGVVYDGRPFEGTEVRVRDGRIELRGPTLMRGYRLDPAATTAAFTDDGWLRTNDAGEVDGRGAVRVFGRVDEMIDSGGEKIWPQEVESAISTHPGVGDVAVAGIADPEWGQRVVAFVVPANGGHAPTLEELRDHASGTIARFKAPRELRIVEELPRTASGKVRRAALGAEPPRERE
jgi:O-succinylbenzoic acid--CoA ligase